MGINLQAITYMLRRRWWIFLLFPLIGGMLGYVVGDRQTPMYSTTSTLMVTSQPRIDRAEYPDIQLAQALTTTYAELILTRPILEPVAEKHATRMTLTELRDSTTVGVSGGTLLSVAVASDDPILAAELANDIAAQFAIYSADNPTIGGIVSVTDFAQVPSSPYAPRIPAYVVLGGVLGALAASATAFSVDRFDTRHRRQRQREHGRRSLAVIPRISRRATDRFAQFVHCDPRSPAAHAIRPLRAAVLGAHADRGTEGGQIVGFFSPVESTGQSAVIASLARSLANSGVSTAIVDLNFLKPGIASYFNIDGLLGIADLLHPKKRSSWQELAHSVSPHLHVLLPGVTFTSSVDALANPRLAQVLTDVSSAVDVVLVDMPAMDATPELSLVARSVDTAVLVAREGRTRRQALVELVVELDHVGVEVLGVVTTFGRREGRKRPETANVTNANIRALDSTKGGSSRHKGDVGHEGHQLA
jgi:succinoglycan biosynthesis transport protein ExoP